MGRSKMFYLLLAIGLIAAVSGLLMMRSANHSLQIPGKVIGWTGIAVVVLARILFARKRPAQQPAKPKS